MKRIFICLFMLLGGNAWANNHKIIVCHNVYALCNAAECTPIAGIKNKALCSCSIWTGKNVGFSSCESRKLKANDYGDQQLRSTFSFGGYHFKVMKCDYAASWASCLDQPCLADKNNPRRAYCTCQIMSSQPFVTFGGECQKKQCNRVIWSGASEADNKLLMNVLIKEMDGTYPSEVFCRTAK